MSNPGFGEALRRVRMARGLTQAQLAEISGYSRTHIARIEGERQYPQHYQTLLGALDLANGNALMADAREESARAPRTTEAVCVTCGTTFAPPSPTSGRPRKRCASCAADRSALGREWRAQNPARVATYNAARRREQATA